MSREALAAWQEAVACYRSQISTFWAGRMELDAAEVLEARWFPLDGLPDEMSPRLRSMIAALDLKRG